MATLILNDVDLLVGAYDLTGYGNQLAHAFGAEMLDETRFVHGGADTRLNKAGLMTNALSGGGLIDLAAGTAGPDERLFTEVGLQDTLVTFAPNGVSAEGDIAYQQLMAFANYQPGSAVGELLAYQFEAAGRQAPIKSQVFVPLVQDSASGASSKINLGAVASGQAVYAGLHVTQFNGTSLDFTVRSDADAVAGGETSRITMTTVAGLTSEQKSLAGPVTDTFWDVTWTFVGTTFTALLVLGIR